MKYPKFEVVIASMFITSAGLVAASAVTILTHNTTPQKVYESTCMTAYPKIPQQICFYKEVNE